jgi:serine/threonine protein kinase
MKIGVLIPTRGDRGDLLAHAKWLLGRQTIQPHELMIVDYPPISDDYDITPRYRYGCEKLFENNPTGCQWQIKEKIGSGQQATVYKVCCDNEEKCDYAVKVYKKVNEEAFHNEVNIHYELTNLGLAVPIMEAFYCDDHGAYIIMKRRQMNAQEYIFKLVDNNVSHDYIMNQIEKLRQDCLNLVLTAYKNRIEQTDANIANFMLDMNGNDYNNIGMIDFAYANKFGVEIEDPTDNDMLSIAPKKQMEPQDMIPGRAQGDVNFDAPNRMTDIYELVKKGKIKKSELKEIIKKFSK